ncbi:unnamed protein product [Sphagnum jensenii]|uniref:Uncharacterized protein n=1 Tax=Sphagnum jensenii TaxID=128206 RepID=A0ABP1AY34_9BRYO
MKSSDEDVNEQAHVEDIGSMPAGCPDEIHTRYVLSRRTSTAASDHAAAAAVIVAKLQYSAASSSRHMHTFQPATTCSKLQYVVEAPAVELLTIMEQQQQQQLESSSSLSSSFRSQSCTSCESGELTRDTVLGESISCCTSSSWHSSNRSSASQDHNTSVVINCSSKDLQQSTRSVTTSLDLQESRKEQLKEEEEEEEEEANSSDDGHLNCTGRELSCTQLASTRGDPNSWLRFPSKLKALFGSKKKTPKPASACKLHQNLTCTQPEQLLLHPRPIQSFESSHASNATAANPNLQRALRLSSCGSEQQLAEAARTLRSSTAMRRSYTAETTSSSSSSSCKGTRTFAASSGCSRAAAPGMQQRIKESSLSTNAEFKNRRWPATAAAAAAVAATGRGYGIAVYGSNCSLQQLPTAFDDTLVSDGRGGTILQGNLSKMRERWLQYMKILSKLPYNSGRKITIPGKPAPRELQHTAAVPSSSSSSSSSISSSTSSSSSSSSSISSSTSSSSSSSADEDSVRPKSMPAIETRRMTMTPAAVPRPKSTTSGGAGASAAGLTISRISPRIPHHYHHNSSSMGSRHSFPTAVERAGFLSATSSPKFSNKMSMGSLKAVKMSSPKVMGAGNSSSSPRRSSNNNSSSSSPRRSSNNNSSSSSSSSNRSSTTTMSELHSSVQGAIAHCKKSHSGQLSQDILASS